jgi:hypothetical protein
MDDEEPSLFQIISYQTRDVKLGGPHSNQHPSTQIYFGRIITRKLH